MDSSTSTYYLVRFAESDGIHHKGDCVAACADDLLIGQRQDCKVRFTNDSPYEDELFARIRPTGMPDEWIITPSSEFVKTLVNGTEIKLVHYLKDGDRISFSDQSQELVFTICHDGRFDSSEGVQYIKAPVQKWLIACLVLLPVILFSVLWIQGRSGIRTQRQQTALLHSFESSILQISVDSVYYIRSVADEETIIGRYSYTASEGHANTGTAFVTDDHRIITARHCIEPWLNDSGIDLADRPADLASLPTRWAFEAETFNQMNDSDTTYKVVSVCTFLRGEKADEPFAAPMLSSEFVFRTDRDDIVEKGDFHDTYYWRSIVKRGAYSAMMLDDIAWAGTDSEGAIHISDANTLESKIERGGKIAIMGYPNYKLAPGLYTIEGKIQQNYRQQELIVHNGELTHGFSGGPMLLLEGSHISAVGVVSRIDAAGIGASYSVPVSELYDSSTNDKN